MISAVNCAAGTRLSMMKGAIARVFTSRQKVKRSMRSDMGLYFAYVSDVYSRILDLPDSSYIFLCLTSTP